MDEFSLIDQYFKQQRLARADVMLGIGDDAALLQVPTGQLLVAAVDTLVADVHFFPQADPYDIGYKALAVNLSDLAAMGAKPAWMTLALTLPNISNPWLKGFAAGLFALADEFRMQLVGGDTTQGHLTVTIQALGFVQDGKALKRSGAKAGDKIYVSGVLGDAGLGLQLALGRISLANEVKDYLLSKLNRPYPRVKLGILLGSYASAAIDISDGLMADLQHLIKASKVGAKIFCESLPFSMPLKKSVSYEESCVLALTAGDDYELCFTVPPQKEQQLLDQLRQAGMVAYCIGEITSGNVLDLQGFSGNLSQYGYKHFT